jgi:uncharacterized Zn-finger protein
MDRYVLGAKRVLYRGSGACQRLWHEGPIMADRVVPHFHNEAGLVQIEIGAHEFMCVGAKPPFDHPHVYLDLGEESEIICPYCSTLYKFNPALDPHSARPPECALAEDA